MTYFLVCISLPAPPWLISQPLFSILGHAECILAGFTLGKSQYVVSYLFNFLPPGEHATASALFITARETPAQLPLVSHYYRADGDEGGERQTEQRDEERGRRRKEAGRQRLRHSFPVMTMHLYTNTNVQSSTPEELSCGGESCSTAQNVLAHRSEMGSLSGCRTCDACDPRRDFGPWRPTFLQSRTMQDGYSLSFTN